MIEKQSAYRVGDEVFANLRDAQAHALQGILSDVDGGTVEGKPSALAATLILDNAEQVKSILGVRQRKPRAKNSTPATRKSRNQKATPEQAEFSSPPSR